MADQKVRPGSADGESPEIPLERILRDIEGALIRISLQRTASLDAAARLLGLTREALSMRMRRLGVTAR